MVRFEGNFKEMIRILSSFLSLKLPNNGNVSNGEITEQQVIVKFAIPRLMKSSIKILLTRDGEK